MKSKMTTQNVLVAMKKICEVVSLEIIFNIIFK